MKILIGPWGNFRNWKEVRYSAEEGKICTSKTSLKCLEKFISPDLTLVLISDTVYETFSKDAPSSYSEIKNAALLEAQKMMEEEDIKGKVLILPGNFSGKNMVFKGKMTDYYYTALYKVADEILKSLKENDKDIEIHIDLTHGINYMTVFTYNAAKFIGSILSAPLNVKFVVYNSEPFNPASSEILNINKVGEETLRFNIDYNPITGESGWMVNIYEGLSKEEKKDLGMAISKFKEKVYIDYTEIDAFSISAVNLFPLAIFSFMPDGEEVERFISSIYEFFEENIEVDQKTVLRKFSFSKMFESVVFAWILSRAFEKVGMKRKEEVTIDELKDFLRSVEDKYDASKYHLAMRELSRIEEKVKDEGDKVKDWMSISLLCGKDEKEQIDRRNLIAHGGFEGNSTQVRNDLKVRYSKDLMENLKRQIINTLKS